ncbi:MAG: hypothetical protein ABJG41_11010 [Cyclobacteriaceae bacterium]
MIKFLVKYLLVLLPFFGGLGHLSAHTASSGNPHPLSNNLFQSSYIQMNGEQDDSFVFVKESVPGRESHSDKRDFFEVEEEEEKDERDRASSKKISNTSHYLTNNFYTGLPGDYFRYIKKSLAYREYSVDSYIPESLNLVFCVFRI